MAPSEAFAVARCLNCEALVVYGKLDRYFWTYDPRC